MQVRPLEERDRAWLRDLVATAWSLPVVTPTGAYADPTVFEGVVAEIDGERAGAVTRRAGAGTAMMQLVRDAAAQSGATRVWLVTTDTNPEAIAFYEDIGMQRARTIPDFVEVVARHKPAVRGAFRDAIEFEWRL